MYNVPFSEEERENIKLMIQSTLYGYLGILLQGRQQFEEEILVGKQKGPLTDQPSTSGMKKMKNMLFPLPLNLCHGKYCL